MEREQRRAHRLQQISEAQAIIEGADMDGLVSCVVNNNCESMLVLNFGIKFTGSSMQSVAYDSVPFAWFLSVLLYAGLFLYLVFYDSGGI